MQSLTKRGDFSPSQRHLMVLDGHKSHITLDVLQKTKTCGLDMISLASHTSHALQALDVACFGLFKKAFRTYRDLWNMQGKDNKVNKKNLSQWASLALKKALTAPNIRAGFKGCGIWPLNFAAMKAKMGPSKVFRNPTCTEFQEDILIQEIWEEGLPNVEEGVVHYFVDHESDEDEFLLTAAAENSHVEEEEADNSALFSTFLRLPQAPTTRKTIVEPLEDYSQSQILTFSQHVEALRDIATQKEKVQLQREERARIRELTKHKRAEKKLKGAAKVDRAATKDAKRKFKEKWTKDAIEDAEEKLHECIREAKFQIKFLI